MNISKKKRRTNMFENLRELTKATQEQKIVLNALMICGCVNWVDYGGGGSIIVNWDDGDYGYARTFTITKKGKTTE